MATLSPMKTLISILLLLAFVGSGCGAAPETARRYATTINPLRAILAEVAGDRAEVVALVPPGASPHTYEPRPSDASAASAALALFYAEQSIDAWAARLPAKHRIAMFAYVPEEMRLPWMETHDHGDHEGHDHGDHAGHDHGDWDGHFWSDPLVVKAMLPALSDQLASLDPEGAAIYRKNATEFAAKLDALDATLQHTFKELTGRPVFMFHPSWNYFMHRYGLDVAGVIEPSPGKESTPKYIEGLIETARARKVRAVFTEPQLPRRPADVLAAATGLPVFELDPNGGTDGRRTYHELIDYNASQLRSALE